MSRTSTDGSAVVVGERFEAWCECPACELFACHHMRAADPYDNLIAVKQDDVALMKIRNFEYEDYRHERHRNRHERHRDCSLTCELTDFAVFLAKSGRSMYEIIRMCECGNQWGMT